MELYLVQHGIAVSEEVDPHKGISREGRLQTLRVLAFLCVKDFNVDVLWHSKKQRAVDTAYVIQDNISIKEVVARDDLSPLSEIKDLPNEIIQLDKNLMIVGHLPFLGRLVSQLITGSDNYELVSFKHSGVVCLDYKDSKWRIKWIVAPDII